MLFLSVCAAVDYAHRNFVVHRDIKPGNILVGPDDSPKLLDFGICKLLADPHSDSSTTDTIAGVLLTPNYASPEQVRGEAVTLLSDVYSLGVVLYELLTDKSFAKLSRPDQADPVMYVSIPRPSEAVTDRTLRRRLSGDLDNILFRALQSDPDRRYESAALLADDLRRHLLDQPIHARPQNFPYRAAKFFRRNRAKLAVAAALILVFATFTNVRWRGRRSSSPVEPKANPLYSAPREPDALAELRESTAEVKEIMWFLKLPAALFLTGDVCQTGRHRDGFPRLKLTPPIRLPDCSPKARRRSRERWRPNESRRKVRLPECVC